MFDSSYVAQLLRVSWPTRSYWPFILWQIRLCRRLAAVVVG